MRATVLLVIAIVSAGALEKKCDKLSMKELLEIVKKRFEEIEQRENEHKCKCSGTDHKKNIAFHVNLRSDIRNLSPKAVVIFDQVVLNMGKAYNPSNGLFSCPEDGVYSFTWTALTSPNTSFESDFVVNGEVVAGNRASAYNIKQYLPATKTVVVKLEKGDIANVAAHGNSAKHIYPFWSSYSGFRVF
ncbi:complement C1q-like protein 2 isoform X2 [Mytilus californianus]|uniref:complement C1q-like protein 2 isoform X2 n=1 Tax=Mytilus californianus TaxID=6549 RepID=UPI00224666A6|nr:complement C1q-like protein 2 isoform X2 [Mytilus californianus]XP_052074358.1 complement C1q-like protein 2 isoform X2 [Mytilus californianus]